VERLFRPHDNLLKRKRKRKEDAGVPFGLGKGKETEIENAQGVANAIDKESSFSGMGTWIGDPVRVQVVSESKEAEVPAPRRRGLAQFKDEVIIEQADRGG